VLDWDMTKRQRSFPSGNYFIVDTDTGGRSKECSLLSLYGEVLDRSFTVIDTIDLKIKPDNGIYHFTAEAMAINKINIGEHEAVSLTRTQASAKFCSFISKHAISSKLVTMGHNVRFDVKFAKTHLLPEWDRYFSYRLIDTSSIAQFLQESGKLDRNIDCSLDSLIEAYAIKLPEGERHTAKFDAQTTLKVYREMVRSLQSLSPTLTQQQQTNTHGVIA